MVGALIGRVGGWLLAHAEDALRELRDPILYPTDPILSRTDTPLNVEPLNVDETTPHSNDSLPGGSSRTDSPRAQGASGSLPLLAPASCESCADGSADRASQGTRALLPAWLTPLADSSRYSFPKLLLQVVLSHTLEYVWLTMLIVHMINGDLLSLPYPLAVFLYGLLESPQPSRTFFNWISGYTLLAIGLKFAYQLPVVCGSPPLELRQAHSRSFPGKT